MVLSSTNLTIKKKEEIMLTEVTKNKHDDLDLARILAGGPGIPDGSICADCTLCGTGGNNNSFLTDKTT